jgi:Tol biopolymer transport system component
MNKTGPDESGVALAGGDVRVALQHILSSQGFRHSARMSRFLEFAVEATLAGDFSRLKETCIGVAVFDRPADYNPKLDPVVRNEARRLRNKLEQYYAAEGTSETVRITIPRGGYVARFETVTPTEPTPEIQNTAEPTPTDQTPTNPAMAEPPRPRPWTVWVVSAILVAVTVTVFAYFSRLRNHEFSDVRFSYLTSLPTREIHPAISPDGRRVIYSSDQNGNYDIYTATLDGQTTQLTHDTANELHPAWSPDGQLFAFLRVAGEHFDILVSPIAGGPERKVARIDLTRFGLPHDDVLATQGSPGPAWSPNGAELAFTSSTPGDSNAPIHVLQLNSGQQRVLTHPLNGAYDFYPAYSPDGKWVAFCRLHSNSTSSVYVIRAAGGEERLITRERKDIKGLAWMPDGRSFVISSNRAGPQRLWSVDVDTGATRPFPTAGTSARDPSVSPDGKWLVYSDYMVRAQIWSLPLNGGAGRSLLPSTRQDHSAQYSPDGKSIAFVSDRSGAWEVWTMLADGSGLRQLTHFEGPLLGSLRWSPDGKYLAFDARPKGHSAIFVIPSLGGVPRPADENSYEEKMPSWSHDGNWIYFNSNRDGMQQLWKVRASGGRPVRIAPQFAMDSAESPDGRTVYFEGSDSGLWEAPSEGGEARPVRGLSQSRARRMWTVAANGIWLLVDPGAGNNLLFYEFGSGRTKAKTALEKDAMLDVPGLSASPDGRDLLYSRQTESRSDLMMVRTLEH